jgi:hypothetical protein
MSHKICSFLVSFCMDLNLAFLLKDINYVEMRLLFKLHDSNVHLLCDL